MSQNYEELNAAWKKLSAICAENGLGGVLKVVRDYYKHELHLERMARGDACRKIRERERERCAMAVAAEALETPTDSEGDIAYDLAISHAVAAVRALKDGGE